MTLKLVLFATNLVNSRCQLVLLVAPGIGQQSNTEAVRCQIQGAREGMDGDMGGDL